MPRPIPANAVLLHGPYKPSNLRIGDRVTCELRGGGVVTSISSGRIPWPRCRSLHQPLGGSGPWLGGDSVRAVRQVSAAAVCYWWGVSEGVVWRWRKVLAVDRVHNDGTNRLVRATAEAGA